LLKSSGSPNSGLSADFEFFNRIGRLQPIIAAASRAEQHRMPPLPMQSVRSAAGAARRFG
jgi:hypothetical protein